MFLISLEFPPSTWWEKVTKLIFAAIVIHCYLNNAISGH